VQAAIQAVHSEPPTDWRQVVALYDHLLALTPTPVVALNRAIAVAELDGPAAALALVDPLADRLGEHHLFHATRGDLLRRLGRPDDAARAYAAAVARTSNTVEREFLDRRRAEL
jgi:RNA polymerase sigma-70 factor (ECF subfamily)